jgi:hypothetical protein
MKHFEEHKDALNKEIQQFTSTLSALLPRYKLLLEQEELTQAELQELGNIEHYLIEVYAQLNVLKEKLEKELFGNPLDTLLKLKQKAVEGDTHSAQKLEKLREMFQDSRQSNSWINWN